MSETATETPTRPAPSDAAPAAAVEPAVLDDHLAAVDAGVEARYAAWRAAVEADVLAPLNAAVAAAAEAHRRIVGADDEDDAPSRYELWRRVRAYRQATRERVVQALRRRLEDTPPAETTVDRLLALLDELPRLADEVPAALTVVEPPDLFAAAATDRPWTRLRKSARRARHRTEAARFAAVDAARRLLRRPRGPAPVRVRDVDLGGLLAYHLRGRVPALLLPEHAALQEALRRRLQRLEAALTAWTHQSLTLDADLDDARFRRPVVLGRPDAALLAADDAADEPASADARDAFAALRTLLQDVLDALAAEPLALADAQDDALAAAARTLHDDGRRAGTFLLPKRALPAASRQAPAVTAGRRSTWTAWQAQALGRLGLHRHLTLLREQLLHREEALVERVATEALYPVLRTFHPLVALLRELRDETHAACTDLADDPAALRGALEAFQQRAETRLREALRTLPGLVASDETLGTPGAETWADLQRLVDELPEQVHLHTLDPDVDDAAAVRGAVRLRPREIAADAFALPLAGRLGPAAEPLRQQIIRAWDEAAQVQHIVQYNLDAALSELAPRPDAEPDGAPDDGPSPVDAACELAADGLGRAAQVLADAAAGLAAPWQAFVAATYEALHGDWLALHRRVRAEAALEEQWVGFRTRLQRTSQRQWRRTGEALERARRRSERILRRGRHQARELIQKGQSAVGVLDQTEEARIATVDAVASVDALVRPLPLVYRRLFTFEALAEPSLVEGRAVDLARLRQHFGRWTAGQPTGALVLSAEPGSGRTTLLNTLAATVFGEADVRRLPLDVRVASEAELARHLGEALGLDGAAPTLEALEAHVNDARRAAPPTVVLVDDLEHLLMQASGGLRLLERFLIFLSRTDTKLYWVAAVSAPAWHFVQRAAGASSGLVDARPLRRLGPPELEQIVLGRHRRSGMPLRFAPPEEPSTRHRLQRRLRRAQTDEEEQAQLRAAFFDRLFRLSGQNVMLALFYWLRSADFAATPGTLVVRPPAGLDFGFLTTFDLPRAFSLKALLLHHTLTLADHNRIFRMDDAQSIFILESLLNLRLIEPVGGPSAAASRIVPDVPYRLRPLLLHPIAEYLRGKHIVY